MGRDKVEKQFDRNIIIKSYLQEIEMLGDWKDESLSKNNW
jgi:hypothetical protein